MMKKSGAALRALTFLCISLLVACGGKKHGAPADGAAADTVVAADTMAAIEAPLEILLTSAGAADIAIGMPTADIPESMPGIYDSVQFEEGYESNTYMLLRDGRPLLTAYEFTPGTVDVMSAESPDVVVQAPDGTQLRLGDEFSSVLRLPGVEVEWENADGEGMWCWSWQGIWFLLDQSRLPEALSRQLYSDAAPPSASAFTPDARIGYMGTGLPW